MGIYIKEPLQWPYWCENLYGGSTFTELLCFAFFKAQLWAQSIVINCKWHCVINTVVIFVSICVSTTQWNPSTTSLLM